VIGRVIVTAAPSTSAVKPEGLDIRIPVVGDRVARRHRYQVLNEVRSAVARADAAEAIVHVDVRVTADVGPGENGHRIVGRSRSGSMYSLVLSSAYAPIANHSVQRHAPPSLVMNLICLRYTHWIYAVVEILMNQDYDFGQCVMCLRFSYVLPF
jgi:hypothetical protein